MLLAPRGLDGSQLGRKRAVLCSHDKKRTVTQKGILSRKHLLLITSNMYILESVATGLNSDQKYALNMILTVEIVFFSSLRQTQQSL